MSDRIFHLILTVFIAMLVPSIVFAIWFANLLIQRTIEQEKNCAEYLSMPFAEEITETLCQRGLIPASLGTCLSPEFSIQLGDTETIFRENVPVGTTRREDVTRMFGDYVTYCQEVPNNGSVSCDYKLSRRGPRVRIYFASSADIVEAVRVPACGDS
jgi:hypothetical protein